MVRIFPVHLTNSDSDTGANSPHIPANQTHLEERLTKPLGENAIIHVYYSHYLYQKCLLLFVAGNIIKVNTVCICYALFHSSKTQYYLVSDHIECVVYLCLQRK